MTGHGITHRRLGRPAGLLLALLALGGCAVTDTYSRPGTWHPDRANAANLAAMAANPADLLHGRGRDGSDSALAAAAIERLWDGSQQPGTSGAGGTAGGAQANGGTSAFAKPLPTTGQSGSP
jgi:hypothetical protein